MAESIHFLDSDEGEEEWSDNNNYIEWQPIDSTSLEDFLLGFISGTGTGMGKSEVGTS